MGSKDTDQDGTRHEIPAMREAAYKAQKYREELIARAKKRNRKPMLNTVPAFEELFQHPEKAEFYFQILKNATPKVIDDAGNYIHLPKVKKSAVIAWYRTLDAKHHICIHGRKAAMCLNNKIPNLKISAVALFYSVPPSGPAFDSYWNYFNDTISFNK
jgi:hypothetical protein